MAAARTLAAGKAGNRHGQERLLAGQWQANLAACLTVASRVLLTLSTGIWTTSGPGSSCLWPLASLDPGSWSELMWDGGRGSRYAIAVPSPGPAWTGKSHEDGEEPCVLVAAIGELGQ